MQRGERRLRILHFLKKVGAEAIDALDFSYALNKNIDGFEYTARAIARRRRKRHATNAELQKVYSLISLLKQDGFIIKENKAWRITKAGLTLYEKLLSRYIPRPCYTTKPSDALMVITFDVPEKERHKRDWLRSTLRNFGFTMLKESVWVGMISIPEDFIHDLEHLHMREYVDIFSVNKSGTIISIPII